MILLLTFIKNQFFQSVKQFGSKSRLTFGPDLGRNCLQSYQQRTKVTASKEKVENR